MRIPHRHPLRPFGLLLAGLLCLPALPVNAARVAPAAEAPPSVLSGESEWLAKKGKGGGGDRKKAGGSRKSSHNRKSSKSGFKSSGSHLSTGSKKPKNGWSQKAGNKQSPSLEKKSHKKAENRSRSSTDRKKADSRPRDNKKNQADKNERRADRLDRREQKLDNREQKLDKRERQADRRDDRQDRRSDKLDRRADRIDDRRRDRWDRWDDRWYDYPGWARPGWGYSRPWNAGWYGGWSEPSWGWWGANAAFWGITSLTTAAIINSAVDDAVSNQQTYIVVPNTDYELLYGTVEPINDQSVRFAVDRGGSETFFEADCNRGTLNGRNPTSASEAELLNAACQVAFGSV